MEKEKYLKPNFSKYLSPLMDFLFHNSDYYEIPKNIKESKEGPFKFSDEPIIPNKSKLFSIRPKDEHHLGENSTSQKLKQAIKSAK
jgi:hypothetical protein